MEYKVAPSLLAADFTRLGEQVHEIEEAGAPYLHLDVMDGAFVPSISFGMPVLKSLRKDTNMTFDVHMMVEEPGRYVEDIKKAGADIITVHAEACTHLDRVVNQIKELQGTDTVQGKGCDHHWFDQRKGNVAECFYL